jgi:hypothetical protein
MPAFKQTVCAVAATTLFLCLLVTPAAAAGPFLFAPWALGHVIGAGLRLATLPLVVASSAASAWQPQAPYPATPGYYGGPPRYYAPPNYYARPPVYYAPRPGYYPAPQAYYRPALAYARPMPQFYAQPRGYYAPSGGFAYRRR